MRFVSRCFALLSLFIGLPLMAQDLTILSKVTKDGGTPQSSISYISADHIRMSQGDGKETIIDFKSGQMTTLDPAKKTYYVITRADFDAMAAKMKEQMNSPEMKKAQEAMKNLPPEQQKRMEAMMGSMLTFDVQDLGTTRKIAGYSCENWTITMGQFSKSDECLTSELQFPARAWEMYRGYADSMKTMMASMGPMAKNMEKMQEQFKKMKGYPLANTTTVNVMGHRSLVASEVTEVKRGPIPATVWEVPAGYTKVDNPMQKAFQGRSNGRD
ncbi:MAG: DUF4412 domain-containing protein [Acidobacteriota bacterium]